jgi:hypothetical protein
MCRDLSRYFAQLSKSLQTPCKIHIVNIHFPREETEAQKTGETGPQEAQLTMRSRAWVQVCVWVVVKPMLSITLLCPCGASERAEPTFIVLATKNTTDKFKIINPRANCF